MSTELALTHQPQTLCKYCDRCVFHVRASEYGNEIFFARSQCKSWPIRTTYFKTQIFRQSSSATVKNVTYYIPFLWQPPIVARLLRWTYMTFSTANLSILKLNRWFEMSNAILMHEEKHKYVAYRKWSCRKNILSVHILSATALQLFQWAPHLL